MKRIYAWIVWFFVLTAAVTSGVYLGMKAVENDKITSAALKKERAQKKVVKNAKAQLLQELQTNAGQLGLSYDYHQVMKDTLSQLLQQKEQFNFPAQLWKGMFAPVLRSAQYHRLAATQQLALLASPLPEKLATVHDLQQQLTRLSAPATDYWWQQELNARPNTTAKALLTLLTRYCVLEQKLDKLYGEVFVYIQASKQTTTKKGK
ncbi:hypothetical protein [Microscilla marina]|uniref:Uncharacterized protein n=1 Tax=Microscilla marina ATCC 23134 TaxID=313606 RepID=A1ZJC4_MICM2|nr:hypothetical protein [Microscilla marina]EAY29660.1 hypothetical protein M23134_00544 [Microscilla marina ATCC 23134]